MTLMKSVLALESELGLHLCADSIELPCLPIGSRVICSCEDYIFCFLEGYQYTVFGVRLKKSGTVEFCPLAYDFRDFIRLILSCGSAAVVAELGFRCLESSDSDYVEIGSKGTARLFALADRLGIAPLDNPHCYIMTVTRVIDFSRIYG